MVKLVCDKLDLGGSAWLLQRTLTCDHSEICYLQTRWTNQNLVQFKLEWAETTLHASNRPCGHVFSFQISAQAREWVLYLQSYRLLEVILCYEHFLFYFQVKLNSTPSTYSFHQMSSASVVSPPPTFAQQKKRKKFQNNWNWVKWPHGHISRLR